MHIKRALYTSKETYKRALYATKETYQRAQYASKETYKRALYTSKETYKRALYTSRQDYHCVKASGVESCSVLQCVAGYDLNGITRHMETNACKYDSFVKRAL